MSRRPPRLNKDTMHCQGGANIDPAKEPIRYKYNSCLSSKYLDYKAKTFLKHALQLIFY